MLRTFEWRVSGSFFTGWWCCGWIDVAIALHTSIGDGLAQHTLRAVFRLHLHRHDDLLKFQATRQEFIAKKKDNGEKINKHKKTSFKTIDKKEIANLGNLIHLSSIVKRVTSSLTLLALDFLKLRKLFYWFTAFKILFSVYSFSQLITLFPTIVLRSKALFFCWNLVWAIN